VTIAVLLIVFVPKVLVVYFSPVTGAAAPSSNQWQSNHSSNNNNSSAGGESANPSVLQPSQWSLHPSQKIHPSSSPALCDP
jgi:hypothetical protein